MFVRLVWDYCIVIDLELFELYAVLINLLSANCSQLLLF